MVKERRRSPRVKCDLLTDFRYQDISVTAHVKNISSSGMYMGCDYPIPLFREISVGIKLPGVGELIECTGVVVRREKEPQKEQYNLAVFFEDIQPADKVLLTGYVERQLVS